MNLSTHQGKQSAYMEDYNLLDEKWVCQAKTGDLASY